MSGKAALEYARRHGLAIDASTGSPLDYVPDVNFASPPYPRLMQDEFKDLCRYKIDEVLPEPKLHISAGASKVLAQLTIKHGGINWNEHLPRSFKRRNLKLDEPVLTGHHETEVKKFKADIRRGNDLERLLLSFSSSPQDREYDSEWDDIVSGHAADIFNEELGAEKLCISKAVLNQLARDLSCPPLMGEIQEALKLEPLKIKSRDTSQSISLPAPEMLSPEIYESSPSDLDEEMEMDDLLLRVENEIDRQYSIDSRTTPEACDVPGNEITDSICDAKNYLEDTGDMIDPSWLLTDASRLDEEKEFYSRGLHSAKDMDSPMTESNKEVKDTNFNHITNNLKLELPGLGRVHCHPTITAVNDDNLVRLMQDVAKLPEKPSHSDEMLFSWQPFPPSLMNVNFDEKIEYDGHEQQYLKVPESIVSSEQLLWKRPGLRLLDDGEDGSDAEIDNNLELYEEIEKPSAVQIPQKRTLDDFEILTDLCSKKLASTDKSRLQGSKYVEDATSSESCFSSAASLNTYLDLRGNKFEMATELRGSASNIQDDLVSSQGLPRVTSPPQVEAHQFQKSSSGNFTNLRVPSTSTLVTTNVHHAFLPSIKSLTEKRSIMVETNLLKTHSSLTRFLEIQGTDDLMIIYRDLLLNRWVKKYSTPDIILAPSKCVVFAPFQALNQRSLPGIKQLNCEGLLPAKIQALAQQYEIIFVLVTVAAPTAGIEQLQHDTVISFAGFCASIDEAAVTPIWIYANDEPKAAPSALNIWSWALICRHALAPTDLSSNESTIPDTVNLIQEVTLWEIFLCRSGLNPLAAQVVLAMLKKADTASTIEATSWGLRRLVRLAPQEKRNMFCNIIGSKAIERLSVALDGD